MRHILDRDLLNALKDSLRDLENIKLTHADEPNLAQLKQTLRKKIAQLENEYCGDNAMAAD